MEPRREVSEIAARRPARAIPIRRLVSYSLLATVVVLGALEALVRLLGVAPAPADLLPASRYLLWEMSPGTRLDGGVAAHINALGLRGPEVGSPKPAGVRRFLTVGDSSVYGFGVADDAVFSTVAARALGERAEAVNGGVVGYSTYQSINLLRMRALQTEPDLLVIGSLWSDNNFDHFVDRELLSAYGGRRTWNEQVREALARTALFRLGERVLVGETASTRTVGWQLLGRPPGPGSRRRVAINDYARNLETLVRIARKRDAEVVFVLLANQADLEEPSVHGWAWDPYRQVMRDTAARHGAPLLDVPGLYRESGLASSALFVDVMHPSSEGHRRIGEALAALLKEKGWLEGKAVMGPGDGSGLRGYEDTYVPPR